MSKMHSRIYFVECHGKGKGLAASKCARLAILSELARSAFFLYQRAGSEKIGILIEKGRIDRGDVGVDAQTEILLVVLFFSSCDHMRRPWDASSLGWTLFACFVLHAFRRTKEKGPPTTL